MRQESVASIEIFESHPGVQYSLEAAAHLTGVSRRAILVYCRSGLVRAGEDSVGALSFDEEALYQIRKIEHLRGVHGVNLAGIRMIFELVHEVQRLREEMRFLR